MTTATPPQSIRAGLLDGHYPKAHEPRAAESSIVIELRVRNHPGTMSHITGLFARRAFNLEAIVCVPTADRTVSVALLLVPRDPRLEQLERQLEKLYDVLEIRHRPDLDQGFFQRFAG